MISKHFVSTTKIDKILADFKTEISAIHLCVLTDLKVYIGKINEHFFQFNSIQFNNFIPDTT